MLTAYARAAERSPVRTNIAVGLGVMFFGDLLSQTVLEHKPLKDVDRVRLVRSSLWNGLVVSPWFLVWFRFLDKRFLPSQFLHKTLVNQLVMPLPTSSAFLTYTTLANDLAAGGEFDPAASWSTAKDKVWRDVPTLVCTSALFWFPVNYLNFAFVPPRYRVLPSICGGVVWGSFLTFIGHRTPQHPTELL